MVIRHISQHGDAWVSNEDYKQLKALCRKLVNAAEYLSGIAESISVSDTQTMRDKLASAIARVDAALEQAKKLEVKP